jgi:hypothetical protein
LAKELLLLIQSSKLLLTLFHKCLLGAVVLVKVERVVVWLSLRHEITLRLRGFVFGSFLLETHGAGGGVGHSTVLSALALEVFIGPLNILILTERGELRLRL